MHMHSVHAALGAGAYIDADCKRGSRQPQPLDLCVQTEVGSLQAHPRRAPDLKEGAGGTRVHLSGSTSTNPPTH